MTHEEAGKYWNGNAEAWTVLARAGYDIYRDQFNTPAFFEKLPNIQGLNGLDIGCGEGHNTRLLAQKGAKMEAIDISEIFIQKATEEEKINPLNIHYQVASAVSLPFESEAFDFATGFMSFMDIPEIELVLQEVFRVLKPNGFLQFSITHPCFDTPHRKNLRNSEGKTYAIEVGNYFHDLNGKIEEWIFHSAPAELRNAFPKFKVPRFTHTISEWLNLLIKNGFQMEFLNEPKPSDETIEKYPTLQDAQVVSYFLHIRVRKPQ